MNLTPVKTPIIAKKMFPNYVWEMPSKEKTIYLTFDDGPTPEITDWTLDVLKQYNAKATFFCIGKNVKNHPDIFHNILSEGHAIGNHSNNHIKGWKTSTKKYLQNIDKAQNIINSQVQNFNIQNSQSKSVNLFRPPYGQITPKQGKALSKLGYKVIMWNILSLDWDNTITKETCLENVINNTSKGSIVVFHDSIKAEENMKFALPKVMQHFSEKGFSFKAIQF